MAPHAKPPPSTAAAVRKLHALIAQNVDPRRGMTNTFVDHICRELCSPLYRGLYPADKLPTARLAKQEQFIIVVNLATSQMLDGHFVMIYAQPEYVLYVDSFGMPCVQPLVRSFLAECRRSVMYNAKQLQRPDSMYCAFYCILFCTYFNRQGGGGGGEREDRRPKLFKLHFTPRPSFRNDELCKKYLSLLLK